MTGGLVTVLGSTGINFGAGMTGGFAYVYDDENQFANRFNHDIDIQRIAAENMEDYRCHLLDIITEFVAETNSKRGQYILDNFSDTVGKFWLIKPKALSLESLLEDLQHTAA